LVKSVALGHGNGVTAPKSGYQIAPESNIVSDDLMLTSA